ncbi:putative F-box protein [Cardamine amara subsp. amara]|uniref:F-box protein n=1 Tax=Cardamine amara subsp. amara TaxID=228776 RepID=A0ABD1BIU1_CARAN
MSIDALDSGAEEPSRENMVTEPMDRSGRERLSEPLFLKKILLEKCGDTSELTIVIMTVHAVMLDSGFVLFNPDSHMSFSFSEQIHSISLNYTLPALISAKESDRVEWISLKFQRLGHMIVVYGSLGVGSLVRKVCFDKRRYVHIVDLLMETLESEKEDTLSIHDKVLMCWRMIKDGFVTSLLSDLRYKAGLELPPCLMCLPPELIRKILESLHGVDAARLACVSSELRELVSDNELWKEKCLKEFENVELETSNVDDWKEMFASCWKEDPLLRFKMFRRFIKFRELVSLRRKLSSKRVANHLSE